MVDVNIAYTLFVEILKMNQYPGAPFTGNIMNDIIMFFFVPMVFIILFIYILLGRIVYGVTWLRALLGIAIFLFMIVNGMFATFAMLSGPYFYFLIVILGAVYFIPSHFGARPAGMPRGGLEAGSMETGGGLGEEAARLLVQIKEVRDGLERVKRDSQSGRLSPDSMRGVVQEQGRLSDLIGKYKSTMGMIRHNPQELARYHWFAKKYGVSHVRV